MSDIHDPIDVGLGVTLATNKGPAPMAMCRCDEPLICTFEFRGAEFYCQVCRSKYGWLGPTPKPATPERQARHDELKALYLAERAEREATS